MMAENPWQPGKKTRCWARMALLGALLPWAGQGLAQDPPANPPMAQPPAQDPPENPPAQPPAEGDKGDEAPLRILGQGFVRTPKNTAEYFAAMEYEIETGNLPLAGRLMGMLLATNPPEAELAQLARTAPLAKILGYRRFSKWDPNPKTNEAYKKSLEDLIKRTSEAYNKSLKDPERIRNLVQYLEGDKREFEYAVGQFAEMGALAIPPLVDVLLQLPETKDRVVILNAIRRLGPNTTIPLIAALSAPDDLLKIDLIAILKERKARQAVGELWLLAGTSANPGVKSTALKAIASITDTPESRLPAPVDALTQQAVEHYQQKYQYPDPNKVEIWRFDEKANKVVRGIPGVEYPTASQVEELFGQRYAYGALKIDKGNRAAQKVLLALGIDKGMARVKETDLSKPLGMTNPKLADFLDTADPTILMELLDQALTNKKTLEVLALVKAIGQQAEPRAAQPWFDRKPLLVRAMSYGERRVEWAAAQSYLRAAEAANGVPSNQVVEVLSRAILGWTTSSSAAVNPSRILVATDNPELSNRLMDRVKETGREGTVVENGGDLLRRLNRASDIDLIILDPNLPGYGTASLVAQLRSDRHYGKLPLVILGLAKPTDVRDILIEYSDNVRTLEVLNEELRTRDKKFATIRNEFQNQEEALRKAEAEIRGGPTRVADRKDYVQNQRKENQERFQLASERAEDSFSFAQRQVTRREKLLARQKELISLYEAKEERRFRQIESQWGQLPSTLVVHGADAAAPAMLQQAIGTWFTQLKLPPLTDEERQIMAEIAVFQLARMADGSPKGYDIRPAAEALFSVLRSNNLADEVLTLAARAVAQIPGAPAQGRLAEFVMDTKRSPRVRAQAADALVMSLRRHTVHLPEKLREDLIAKAKESSKEPELREKLGSIIGVLKPSVSNTGERLLEIQPKP